MGYEAVIVDLDGTVYNETALIPGAKYGIKTLRSAGVQVQFLTNAAIRSQIHYKEKLNDVGISAASDEILTSGVVTATYLASNHPNCVPFVVGESALREELRGVGLDPTEKPSDADTLVVGLDRDVDYRVLTEALRALDNETRYIATNPDAIRPGEDGQLPSTGAIIGAIEGMTGREPDVVAGKPSDIMAETASERLGVDLSDCLIVGDRLDTDIKMGSETGMTTVLVRSGVTDEDDLRAVGVRPDYIIDSLEDIGTVL